MKLSCEQLLEFLRFNHIPSLKGSKEDLVANILTWQESVLQSLGFVERTPHEAINFHDWGKAIPRRRTYEWDRCQLIHHTGFMEIRDVCGNCTMFVRNPNGYQFVLNVEIQSGGWSGYYGCLLTDGWRVSGAGGTLRLLWTEAPRHLTRQQFLEAAFNPPERTYWDEDLSLSMAAYEVRKYQRVLSAAFNTFSEDLFSDLDDHRVKWRVGLGYSSTIYSPDADSLTRSIEVSEFSQTEQVTLTFRLRTRHSRQHCQVSVAVAPLILLAFFRGMRKIAIDLDRESDYPQLQDDSGPSDTLAKEALSLYDRWLAQLESIAVYREEVLESFKSPSLHSIFPIMIPELQALQQEIQQT